LEEGMAWKEQNAPAHRPSRAARGRADTLGRYGGSMAGVWRGHVRLLHVLVAVLEIGRKRAGHAGAGSAVELALAGYPAGDEGRALRSARYEVVALAMSPCSSP